MRPPKMAKLGGSGVRFRRTSLLCWLIGGLAVYPGLLDVSNAEDSPMVTSISWNNVESFSFESGLDAYWNVADRLGGETERQAIRHGFRPLKLVLTYADYVGAQKENIVSYAGGLSTNPWDMPPFFEKTVRSNISSAAGFEHIVHNVEIFFHHSYQEALRKRALGLLAEFGSEADFETEYLKQSARWYTLPVRWTRERFPDAKIGLFGPQIFDKEYNLFKSGSEEDIGRRHRMDFLLWREIDSSVDFAVSDVYLYQSEPDNAYFIGENIDRNVTNSTRLSGKPVYAYVWMRYFNTEWKLATDEVSAEDAELLGIVPFFYGAKAIVLWGYEPNLRGDAPYANLPSFAASLGRVARLSSKIAEAKPLTGTPAFLAWQAQQPLLRQLITAPGECVVMAVNPWQDDTELSNADVACSGTTVKLAMKGRHVTLAAIAGDQVTLY